GDLPTLAWGPFCGGRDEPRASGAARESRGQRFRRSLPYRWRGAREPGVTRTDSFPSWITRRSLPVYDEELSRREERLRRTWESLDPALRTSNQVIGRRSTMGCVALEITQRCNLDCTLCYLSESSESVRDLPLSVVFERIDRIRETYGPGVGVQVTGGDPTLRPRAELVAIVRRLAEAGLRPSLFTNGIRATRDLLRELADAGLFDVAFH